MTIRVPLEASEVRTLIYIGEPIHVDFNMQRTKELVLFDIHIQILQAPKRGKIHHGVMFDKHVEPQAG